MAALPTPNTARRAYRDHLDARSAPGRMHAMRMVKGALDPAGILNPGAVLPD